MNRTQRIIVISGVLLIAVMILIPPWYHPVVLNRNLPDGYHWFFYSEPSEDTRVKIDIVKLSVQIIAVVILTSTLAFLTRRK